MSLTSSQPPLSERPPRELLCEKCRGISWNVLKSYDDTAIHGLGFHGTFRELEDSCDQGCPMCQNLRCMLVYDGVVSKTDDPMHWGITGFGSVMLGSSELPYSERREYFMWKDNNIQSPGQRLPYVQRLAPDTLEDDLGILIDNINEWLTACTVSGKHKTCTSLESCTSPLPTRLIDVGDQDRDIPRLIESETEYPSGSTKPLYLILSYRWGGGNQSARTTHSNVRERRKQIPLQDLPRTIQDAIKITRRMKIRYLWVDAVCIIQPDNDGETEEWLKESANMSDYYSNAYCCIAASSAEDSSDGILVERPIAKFTFKEWHNPGGTTIDPPHSSRRLFRNPLLERGWCLQEWLLSPRILHWTRNGLIWQCKKGFFWEGQKVVHDECPEHVPDSRAGGTRLNNDCLFEMEFSQGQSTEIWRILDATKDRALGYLWSSLIYCYSQMNLTKPGDRLIAIQGIATYLSNRHKINYFAGIFEHGYLDGLLWSREWRGKPITRIEEFPTWSWASAKGTIVLPYVDNDVSIPWMRWTGGFPSSNSIKEFNKTSNRQIHITAPLVPFKVIVESSKWTRGQFTLHSSSLVWPGKQIGVTLDFAEPDSSCFEGTFLLFLRQLREPQMYRDDLNGLVLKRPSSAGCNVYERIGVFGLYPRKFLQVITLEETRCLEEWRTDVILV